MHSRSEGSTAVLAEGVSKSFRVPKHQVHTLKERVLHPMRRSGIEEFEALRDVNFAVETGGFFGIVGRNGSGKSTLLKCLAGIYKSDSGLIRIDGRVSTFIELGVGFNPDLAARDNIAINGAILGLSRREARRRFDAVIDFAELRGFSDLKLKNYSSGMMVRLAFAVMIEIDADVLLIDEVLAVGDAAFQQKCFDEFEEIRRSGRTVLLVTHDMGAVRRFCDHGILLDKGRVLASGSSEEIGDRYLDINFAASEAAAADAGAEQPAGGGQPSLGTGDAEILGLQFEAASGGISGTLPNGAKVVATLEVHFPSRVEDPVFAFTLKNGAGTPLFSPSSSWELAHSGTFAAGETVQWRVSFDNILGPDRYSASAAVTRQGGAALCIREDLASVVVTRSAPTGTLVDIPFAQELVSPTETKQEVSR